MFVHCTRREGCQGGECLYTARGGRAARVVSVCTLHKEWKYWTCITVFIGNGIFIVCSVYQYIYY